MMFFYLKWVIMMAGAILLQTQEFLGSSIDWLGLFSVLMVLRIGLNEALFLTFAGGLVWDSLSGNYLAVKSLALSFSCILVGILKSVINYEHVMTRSLMVFLGIALLAFVESLLTTVLSDTLSISAGHYLRSAGYTTLVALPIYTVLGRFMKRRDMYGHWMAA